MADGLTIKIEGAEQDHRPPLDAAVEAAKESGEGCGPPGDGDRAR